MYAADLHSTQVSKRSAAVWGSGVLGQLVSVCDDVFFKFALQDDTALLDETSMTVVFLKTLSNFICINVACSSRTSACWIRLIRSRSLLPCSLDRTITAVLQPRLFHIDAGTNTDLDHDRRHVLLSNNPCGNISVGDTGAPFIGGTSSDLPCSHFFTWARPT